MVPQEAVASAGDSGRLPPLSPDFSLKDMSL
jgi:hypothetical protein